MQIDMGMNVIRAGQIEKDEFEHILEEHSKWLADPNTGKRADLRNKNFSKWNLSGIDLSYADLNGSDFSFADMSGSNLAHASLQNAFLLNVNLSRANIDGADFCMVDMCHAELNGVKGKGAHFNFSTMWDCNVSDASLENAGFLESKLCDCNFTGSNLENACLAGADLDDAIFAGANLKNADFMYARRTFWCDFTNADMTGVRLEDVDIDPKNIKGAKGYCIPLYCPEEGSFIAWKKCRDGKVLKLMIPEDAMRKGESICSCRASKAVVLDIFDKDGKTASQAYSIYDPTFEYVKGATVFPKVMDYHNLGDVEGIYFVLSRSETDCYHEKDE